MMMTKTVLGPEILTVIIRDDGPMVHAGDSPVWRSVRIILTEDQRQAIALRVTHRSCGDEFYEQISKCFLEEGEKND